MKIVYIELGNRFIMEAVSVPVHAHRGSFLVEFEDLYKFANNYVYL